MVQKTQVSYRPALQGSRYETARPYVLNVGTQSIRLNTSDAVTLLRSVVVAMECEAAATYDTVVSNAVLTLLNDAINVGV